MCALLIAELDAQYAPLVLLRASRAKPPEPGVAATSGAELNNAALTAEHVDQFFKVRAPSGWVGVPGGSQPRAYSRRAVPCRALRSRVCCSVVYCAVLVSSRSYWFQYTKVPRSVSYVRALDCDSTASGRAAVCAAASCARRVHGRIAAPLLQGPPPPPPPMLKRTRRYAARHCPSLSHMTWHGERHSER